MTGFDASAWNSPGTHWLVVAPNWLGDGVMAMPALQVLRDRLPEDTRLDLLCRSSQAGLWQMHPAVDTLHILNSRTGKLLKERKHLRASQVTHAVLLPHSFRSALLPTLAGIPHRRGTHQGRPLLINSPVDLSSLAERHQQWENAALLLPTPLPQSLPAPSITPPEDAIQFASKALTPLPSPCLALIPGAARGPSKQWPARHFLATAKAWQEQTGGSAVFLGTPADTSLCEGLAAETGGSAVSLAGQTSLQEFTAVLNAVRAVVANDSGGMHLAAAVNTPVVAVFGRTDPGKTGPLHPEAVIIQAEGGGQRRISRNDQDATEALQSITPEQVIEPVLAIAGQAG